MTTGMAREGRGQWEERGKREKEKRKIRKRERKWRKGKKGKIPPLRDSL